MTNEYAALLEPDPRKFYHYMVVLPAVDRNQRLEEEASSGQRGGCFRPHNMQQLGQLGFVAARHMLQPGAAVLGNRGA